MKRIELAPAARHDPRDITRYIAEDNPSRAETFVAEIEAVVRTLAERPLSFPAREDISAGLRGTSHGRYIILFRDLPDRVRVVRILHGARDAAGLARHKRLQ